MYVFKAVVSFFNKITKDTQEVSLWRRDMVPQNIIRVLLAGVFFFYSTVCYALPEGYQVQAGTAEFNQPDSNTLNIDTSDRVIINYNSFSIANPEAVNFNQPGGDSVALNRVTGGSISEILGTLTANGKIFLVNPNGVLFGPNSSV
ncbi:MAG: filamentous hemagglutinin N-terminal domain-containing protein, partial [Candidatus Kaelpia imicola]|nr:filamentous hemagglutinin N-terminal domain-containing protein [Candidatus Kaelpia imicola]